MLSKRDGFLYLEEVRLADLLARVETPFYVYSLGQVRKAWLAWEGAAAGLPALLGYAVKANHNPALLQHLAAWGAGAVVASDLELEHALRCGFPAARVLMHGNGKRRRDLLAALRAGVLLSADSAFDLRHIEAAAGELGCSDVPVLLRVNPDIDPQVHPYISTGMHDSKFGVPAQDLGEVLAVLSGLRRVVARGLHCHIGSALMDARPFVDAARLSLALALSLRQAGLPIDTLDLGGGLGIDYTRGQGQGMNPDPGQGAAAPTPTDLLGPVRQELQASGLRLIVEPGRSLVGPAGVLVGRVVGIKHNPRKSFLVTDASMAQLIRPSLYGAYHHIELLSPAPASEGGADAAPRRYDVVGPLCESGDFLGQDRLLPTPAEGDGIAILDAGAYGFSMASRYNLHLLCAEYLIEGERVRRVRRAETYEDFSRTFTDEDVTI